MILVTGARGHLAAQTLAQLRMRGAAAVGGSRTPGDGERFLDFDDPASLDLDGVTTLVLVSAGYAEDDEVIARHTRVIAAAVRDGVHHIVYTSVTAAGDHLGFAPAHRATERLLMDSGLQWTILRNGLYAELIGALMTWTSEGFESAFGSGSVAAVAREDLAAAAAVVAATPADHQRKIYDLVGEPFTADDLAAQLGATHTTISLGEYRSRLLASDELLPFQPPMLLSIATSVRHNFLSSSGTDLRNLLGQPPVTAMSVAAETAASLRPAPA